MEFTEAAGGRDHVRAIPDRPIQPHTESIESIEIDDIGCIYVGGVIGGKGRHHRHQPAKILCIRLAYYLGNVTKM